MKLKNTVLTKEEREVLILAATPRGDQHLSNTDIGQRLGIPVGKVKILLYQTCVKLGAKNRNEAILFAIKRGEIKINQIYTLDELVEFYYSSLCPDVFRRIMRIACEGMEYGHIIGEEGQIINTDKKQDTILTKRERDILILVGRGHANREIADTLCISTNSVRKILYRIYTKLGTHKRTDAAMLALKQREISMGEMYSFNELVELLATLGPETLEKITKMLSQRLEQETIITGS